MRGGAGKDRRVREQGSGRPMADGEAAGHGRWAGGRWVGPERRRDGAMKIR
jgi:hypothetical protein